MVPRPYLHIYTRSNELEEVGVVSLTGVNVESDPHKSSLLGVRLFYVAPRTLLLILLSEAFLLLLIHILKLSRTRCSKSQRT